MATQTVNYNLKTWKDYAPGETSAAYGYILPRLQVRADQGLSDTERSMYRGQIMSGVARSFKGAEKNLLGGLARAGARGGDVSESLSNLERSRAEATAKGLSTLPELEEKKKQQNLENLLKALSIPSGPAVGGTTTYAQEPKMGGS